MPPQTASAAGRQASTSSGPHSSSASNSNNNNNNNNNSTPEQNAISSASAAASSSKQAQRASLGRKRSSVGSNLSSLTGANGSGHGSLHSCTSSGGSTNTSADDLDSGERSAPAHYTNAEYEHIRNTTLLFFLDRLYMASQEGKEARTLHDLACLFGTKEFTKDMRQIVGASRNGLKRFLQSYPSLFEIEGDKVHLTQLKANTQVAQRDYNSEAAEYFKQKLMQFGTSLVPIKNLFGYRSQAPQEVRHVSGKNTRDFKRFLKQNEHVFEILADEHVMLKSALRELESQGQTSLALEQSLQPLEPEEAIVTDPYLNKQFAHLVEDCIKKMRSEQQQQQAKSNGGGGGGGDSTDDQAEFKVTLEYLHERIQQQHCQNELFPKIVKTIDDLKVFLRMHPNLFKRFSAPAPAPGQCDDNDKSTSNNNNSISNNSSGEMREYVSLLSEADRRLLEARANFSRQSSTIFDQSTAASSSHSNAESTTANKLNEAAAARQSASSLSRQLSSGQKSEATGAGPQAPPAQTLTPPVAVKASLRNEPSFSSLGSDREEPRSLPSAINHFSHPAGASSTRFPVSTTKSINNNNNMSMNISKASLASQQQLRANAPPFVPSKPKQHQQLGQQPGLAPMQRSLSNLAPGSRALPPGFAPRGAPLAGAAGRRTGPQQAPLSPKAAAPPPAPIDQRQAIRSYLLKGSQTGGQHHNLNWAQHEQQDQHQQQQQHQQQFGAPAKPVAMPAVDSGDMRARTVDIVREASNIITRIMTTTDAVAFDCKGYNLGFDGQITLIQFGYLPRGEPNGDPKLRSQLSALGRYPGQAGAADSDSRESDTKKAAGYVKPEVCVFDLITNPELAYCLKPLLESDKIVKIVHDVRNKSNALHVQFDITLKNVFDTQVANLVIQQQDTGKPAYKSRYISMSKLCEIYGNDELLKYRNLIKFKTRHSNGGGGGGADAGSNSRSSPKDANYWRTRPLTKPMIFEATMDVYCLVGTIYQNLKEKIKPEYEPLFDQLNLEGVFARIKPDEIRSVKKERKIDLEVIDLKRKLYSDTTGPVVLSNREIRLLRHIDLTEEVRQKIQQCKKVAKKLERLDMKAAQLREQLEGPQSMASSTSQLSSMNINNGAGTGTGQANDDDSIECEDRRQGTDEAGSKEAPNKDQPEGPGAQQGDSATTKTKPTPAEAAFADKMDEFNATGMMMDSSVLFEELKDKMIESSSLLESLEDDDDDDGSGSGGHCGSGHLSSSGHQHSHQDCCKCQCHRSSSDSGSADSSIKQQLSRSGSEDQSKQMEESPSKSIAAPVEKASSSNIASSTEPKEATTTTKTEDVASSATGTRAVLESGNVAEGSGSAQATGDKSEPVVDPVPVETKQQQQQPNEQTKVDESEQDDSNSSLACDMAVQCDLINEL